MKTTNDVFRTRCYAPSTRCERRTHSEIELAPLARESTGQLIADSLHCDRARADQLSALVDDGGNPFFVIQFLTTLADKGLLTFDPDAARWT